MPVSESDYQSSRAELLHHFAGWRPQQASHGYADLALDFKYYYGDGEVLRWSVADVEELLLDWVPRKVLMPDGRYGELAAGIRDFFRFLAQTDRLAPGSASLGELEAAVARCAPVMARRATDPAHYGMAKGMIADSEPPPIVVPYRPEADLSEAARIAEASLAYRRLCALHDYFSEPRPLTQRGNLRLADARHLVEVLETGDRMDEVIGDRQFKTKSSAELVGLVTIVEFAKRIGVLRVHRGRLVAVKRWAGMRAKPLEAVVALADRMIADGPLAYWPTYPRAEAQIFILESAIPALLSWTYDGPLDHGHLIDAMVESVNRLVALDEMELSMLELSVSLWMERIVTSLEDLGLVHWRDAATFEEWGRRRREAGELVLTELGLYWCQQRLEDYGVIFEDAGVRLADGGEAVVAMLASRLVEGVDEFVWFAMELGAPDELAAAVETWWRVDHPRVGAVLEALERAMPSPKVRRAAHRARFKHRNR